MPMLSTVLTSPNLKVAEFVLVLAALLGGLVTLLEVNGRQAVESRRVVSILDRERDIAAGLGWRPKTWLIARVGATLSGLLLGIISGIPLLIVVGGFAGFVGFRWAFAGRAATRRLNMERAFLGQLRNLRDRMAISNQSLDTALQEVGRNRPSELQFIFEPFARGGSVASNIVDVGVRSRSPIVEYACGVLLWSRTRSLDTLIEAIDEILLDVGEAQLAVQEESLVTLSQQRAVTMAMTALMVFMFVAVVRVDLFRSYYQQLSGQIVLLVVLGIFAGLVGLLGAIVRVRGWTRWDLRRLAEQQDRLGG